MSRRKSRSRIVSSPTSHLISEKRSTNSNENKYLLGLYDNLNPIFAEKHYLTYVMMRSDSELNNNYVRFYLSKSNKDEFGKNSNQKRYLLDEFPEFNSFIENFLIKTMGKRSTGRKSKWLIKDTLLGAGLFLDYLASGQSSENIENIQDIDEQTQVNFNQYAEIKPLKGVEFQYAYRFFYTISKATGRFKAKSVQKPKGPGTPAYPTTVIYKLDYFARQSLKEHIAFYDAFSEAIEESKEFENLFTLENLLKTRYSEANFGSTKGSFLGKLDALIERKYGIKPKVWSIKRGEKYRYPNKEAKCQHTKLIKMSEQGIDITPNTLPLKLWWFFEFFPDWPRNNKLNLVYSGIFAAKYHNAASVLGLNLDDLNTYFMPPAETIYPLFLLLQMRTGKNTQPLTDLKIEQEKDTQYSLGLRLDDGGRRVFSVKNRTNSEDYIFLHADEEIDYYIEKYLEWLGLTIYEHSRYKHFFQGYNPRSKNAVFFTASRRSIASRKFLGRYEVFNHETNERLKSVNHMRLRSSFAGAAYLRGLKEYEIKHLLRHEQESTQHSHYGNHVELEENKLRRLAWAQRKITDLFRGLIIKIGKNTLQLGKGVLADCADSKTPTHEQKPKLKEGHECRDWTMCLLCEKSRVIDELHGPVIIAMKLYLEEIKESIATREWEKEFRETYDSVESALLKFSDAQKKEFNKSADKHRALCETAILVFRKKRTAKGSPRNEYKTV